MHVFVTTCTATKDPSPGDLPAIRRYRDPRIDAAVAAAEARSLPLCIFSGRLGLIDADSPVAWYDSPLQAEAVAESAIALARTLQRRGITRITALLEDRATSGWAPYHDAIEQGCSQADVALCKERWRGLPSTQLRKETVPSSRL